VRARRTVRAVHAVQAVVLVGLLAGPLAYAHADHSVTVVVDGAARSVHSFAPTVGALLSEQGVHPGPHDALTPPASTAVRTGMTVTLTTARPVWVDAGGVSQQTWTVARTVGAFAPWVRARYPGAVLDLAAGTPIPPEGLALSLRLPQHVRLDLAGRWLAELTTATTWSQVLAQAGVRLRSGDRVATTAPVPTTGATVVLTTVGVDQRDVVVSVPYATHQVADAGLPVGTQLVSQAGLDGLVEQVWAVTLRDGRPIGQRLVAEHTLRPTRDAVIRVGTATPAPAAPPAPVAPPPVTAAGSGGGLDWTALADCESGGNPTAVGGGGAYFGLYQFSLGAWASVGGSGNPASASPAQQTYRAQLLYDREGRAAWPACGALL